MHTLATIVGITILVVIALNHNFNQTMKAVKAMSLRSYNLRGKDELTKVFLFPEARTTCAWTIGRTVFLWALVVLLGWKFEGELIGLHFKLFYPEFDSLVPRSTFYKVLIKQDILAGLILSVIAWQSVKTASYALRGFFEIPVAVIVPSKDYGPILVWWDWFTPLKHWKA